MNEFIEKRGLRYAFGAAVVLGLLSWTSAAASVNRVPNPGFERADERGHPVGCHELGTLFRRDPTGGVDGSAALLYENDDPKAPRILPQIPLALECGKAYLISFKVRCENLKGGTAGFCLEWNGPDGKWDNGVYALKHITGTTGWTAMTAVTPRFPPGRSGFRFTPGVSRGATGKAWYDDVVVEELPPQPIECVISDAYRNVAPTGSVTFTAFLNVADVVGGTGSCVCAFQMLGPDGKTRDRQVAVGADRALLALDVEDLAMGTHPVTFTLRDASGKVWREALDFTRADPGRRAVYIDSHLRTIVDGRPFFPLGMYWLDVKEEDLARYAKGPFNCLRPYARNTPAMADLCQKYGMKLIVGCGAYRERGNLSKGETPDSYAMSVLSWARNHSATLAYYVNDENPLSMRDSLRRRQDLIAREDPGHPTLSVICQTESTAGYLPTADVLGSDPYPAPGDELWLPMKWMRQKQKAARGARPIWQVTQTFDKGAYSPPGSDAARKSKFPTEREMRCMIWQNLACGARGLLFYSFFDLKKMDWKTPFDESWAIVCRLGEEVRRQTDVFLSVEEPPVVKTVGLAPEWLAHRVWRLRGETYLLAVNGTKTPMSATFELSEKTKDLVLELGEPMVRLSPSRLRTDLPPLGVSFVRLGKSVP